MWGRGEEYGPPGGVIGVGLVIGDDGVAAALVVDLVTRVVGGGGEVKTGRGMVVTGGTVGGGGETFAFLV